MKTILPWLGLLFLVSCSHPPPPQFQPFGQGAHPQAAPSTPAPGAKTTWPATPSGSVTETTNSASVMPGKINTNAPVPPAALPTEHARVPAPIPTVPSLEAALGLTNRPTGAAQSADDIIPPGTINFPATDLNQVLQIYAELVNRTILRPANLGAPLITLKTQTPLTKKEAIAAFDAVLAMNGITMINVGEKFVKAVPVASAPGAGEAPDKRHAADLPEIGPYVTHVAQLKFVRPSEVVQALTPFAQIPNSILPIDSSQILVLRDYTENVKRMLEMIERIDVSVPSEFLSEVIPIRYAKAADIANALNSLSSGGGGTSIGSSTGGGRPGGGAGGMNRPGLGGAGGVGGVGGVGQPYGAQATPGAPGQPSATGGGSSFSERLRNIIKSANATSSGDLQILGQTKIIADERSNALLIFATRQDMDMIKGIVAKLDVVLAQVLIETAIMDVQIGKTRQFSLSAVQTPKQYNANVAGAGGYNNGNSFFDQLLNNGGGATNASALLGGIGSGGLAYWAKLGSDFNAALRAAASDERINVIQKPQILTTHATPGSIFIGSTVPYVTSTYYGGGYNGGPSSSYQQLQVGIGLTVTPYINSDGLVVMEIDEDISELAGSTAIQGVGDVPNTTSRKFSAEVAVLDGNTVMLGGFIRNSSDKTKSGVPILKDIPLLGALFASQGSSKTRDELVVLMKPTVLKTPAIAAIETAKWKESLPGVGSAEAEVNLDVKKEVLSEKKQMLRDQKELEELNKETAEEQKKLNQESGTFQPKP